MKHFLPLISILLLSVGLASCRSDEPFKNVVFADSPDMFNVVTPVGGSRGVAQVVGGVTYHIAFDDEHRNASLTISNLKVSPDDEGIIVTFPEVDWTYEPGSHEKRRIIEAPELHSSAGLGGELTITDVVIVFTQSNMLSDEKTSGFYASYVVNGRYRIISYPFTVYSQGTTAVSLDGSTERRIDYAPTYVVSFDPSTMTANLSVDKLTLGDRPLDFTIERLRLALTDDGYRLTSTPNTRVVGPTDAAAVPQIAGELNATAELRNELDLDMTLSFGGADYHVEAFLTPDLNVVAR